MRQVAVELLGRVKVADGGVIECYRLQAGSLALETMTLGGAITSLHVPDHAGRRANVVLAHSSLERYAAGGREYFGAIIGRVANRIAGGQFQLDGRTHQLHCNDGRHHLHGGIAGFDQHCWHVRHASAGAVATIEFERTSPAGEEGYPGEVHASVTYTLHPEGEVQIVYDATTDAPTVVNMTNHSYFNLQGEGRGDVLEHELQVAADQFLPVDASLIPTGALHPVANTAFDFREPARIGQRLGMPDPQLQLAGGFDHCMVLQPATGGLSAVRHACTLRDRVSRRLLEVWTDQPGMQLYSGNFLDGTVTGPSGRTYQRHGGVCLETQGFPDAPNQPRFPSITLMPGQRYRTVTMWRFDVLP